MKILIVTDQYFAANNGMTISARRFASAWKKAGHEIRIMGWANPEDVPEGETAYLMKKQYIPFFDKLVSAQGMTFAKPDKEKIREAVEWADLIHFYVPFVLTHAALKEAMRTGTPYTAAFHVQPENVSASIHMGNVRFFNSLIYHWFHFYVYKYCKHIHCPSKFIAGELVKHGYKEQLHVISNGIDPDFKYRKIPKTAKYEGKFVVLMIGRMSIEKRQDVLISAVAKSKYKDRIRLVLAGKGPRKEFLTALAKRKKVDTEITFFPKPALLDMIAMSDLYVHAADMEIEAMACMEGFAGGLVPVIANSGRSATPQFALDDRSLFKAGDSEDLAKKIDYWIEHSEERADMEHKYSELAEKYKLEDCAKALEEMFFTALREAEEKETENATSA